MLCANIFDIKFRFQSFSQKKKESIWISNNFLKNLHFPSSFSLLWIVLPFTVYGSHNRWWKLYEQSVLKFVFSWKSYSCISSKFLSLSTIIITSWKNSSKNSLHSRCYTPDQVPLTKIYSNATCAEQIFKYRNRYSSVKL